MPVAVVRFSSLSGTPSAASWRRSARRSVRCSSLKPVEQALGLEVDLGSLRHGGQPSPRAPRYPIRLRLRRSLRGTRRRPPSRAESPASDRARNRSRPRQHRIRRRRAPRRACRGAGRRRDRDLRRRSRPSGGSPRSTTAIDALMGEHEPDAVALEELYFGAERAQRVRRRPGARRRDARRRSKRGAVRGLHPAAGQGRRLRLRPRRQGPGRADGRGAARAARAAPPRPRRRRARGRRLPPEPGAARRGAGAIAHAGRT